MKIRIGPYIHWIGPFQIAEKIPFISEDTQDKIAEWISETWIIRFLTWIHEKRNRKIDIRIDPYDTWSMDHTLALIIVPMLKQLRDTKHGSPLVDNEDVPPHMRYSSLGPDEPEWHPDNWVHYKWEWVLNELIWTFEQLTKDDDLELYSLDLVKQIEYNDRIKNGLRLFGKYYRGLWD
jgi:hypothetical protein